MAYDVFLSSKSEDYAFAQQVCEYLTQNEYRVFFSQRVLQEKGAADFRAQIDRAIEASQHLVVVTSRGQHVKGGWVEAEWGSFVNEKRSGRKEGNVVTVTFGNVAIEELPLALRQFEVLPWTPEGKRNLLSFVAPVVQEIFRIDLRANRIHWRGGGPRSIAISLPFRKTSASTGTSEATLFVSGGAPSTPPGRASVSWRFD